MNILFCSFFDVSSTKGGTERITTTVSEGLKKAGHKCFLLYFRDIESDSTKTDFEKRIRINKINTKTKPQIKNFLIENDIDTLIIQGLFEMTAEMKNLVSEIDKKKISIIFVHHFNPGAEESFLTFRKTVKSLKESPNNKFKNLTKTILYPIAKLKYHLKLRYHYKQTYLNADKVVLLSERFIDPYIRYAQLTNKDKFHIIHNALSFNSFFDIADYNSKKKEIVIISRLEEKPKRIGLALRIWKKIEALPMLEDWSLIIVGKGSDEAKYKQYVKNHNLQRVFFEGRKEPQSYYQKASIFMMTSSSEGWGLTLTEAQQYGVVPIAFDSYASLHDIIQDGENGFIIPNNNISEYVEKLKFLIINHDMRKEMASLCIESSKRFSQENILQEWIKLLNSINELTN